jgi:hypothetical protein
MIYPVIGEPPLFCGGVKATEAESISAVAFNAVGGPGTVIAACGVTGFDGAEATEFPFIFVATTVIVTATPLTSPGIVIGSPVASPLANCPLDAVAVYPVIAEPPLLPAVKLTVACPFPAFATSAVGGLGTVEGVTGFDATL